MTVLLLLLLFRRCLRIVQSCAGRRGSEDKRKNLNEEFMNVLKVLSSNMLAGYSVENAWQEAEKRDGAHVWE